METKEKYLQELSELFTEYYKLENIPVNSLFRKVEDMCEMGCIIMSRLNALLSYARADAREGTEDLVRAIQGQTEVIRGYMKTFDAKAGPGYGVRDLNTYFTACCSPLRVILYMYCALSGISYRSLNPLAVELEELKISA